MGVKKGEKPLRQKVIDMIKEYKPLLVIWFVVMVLPTLTTFAISCSGVNAKYVEIAHSVSIPLKAYEAYNLYKIKAGYNSMGNN